MSNQYMPMYCGDYLGDTMHLTTEEHGAYLLLLMAMWRRGGTVPDDDDDLCRIVRLDRQHWQSVKKRLRPLLTFKDGFITQKRLQEEVEKAKHISAVRKLARASRGKKSNDLAPTNEPTNSLHADGMVWSNSTEVEKNKRGEVPENWVPGEEQVRRWETRGFTPAMTKAECEKFINFHRSKGNTFKRVWQAFDTWMGNAKDWASKDAKVGVRKNGSGYYIKPDSEEFAAWKRHALKISDNSLLGRLQYNTGEVLVPTRWPQFK